jgi:hypothetical protein
LPSSTFLLCRHASDSVDAVEEELGVLLFFLLVPRWRMRNSSPWSNPSLRWRKGVCVVAGGAAGSAPLLTRVVREVQNGHGPAPGPPALSAVAAARLCWPFDQELDVSCVRAADAADDFVCCAWLWRRHGKNLMPLIWADDCVMWFQMSRVMDVAFFWLGCLHPRQRMREQGSCRSESLIQHTHLCVGVRRGGVVAMCRHGDAARRNVDGAGGQTCSKSSIPTHVYCGPAGPHKKGEAGSGTSSSSTTCTTPKGCLIFFSLFVCSSPILDSD